MVVMSSASNVDLLEFIDLEQGKLMQSSVQMQEEPVLKISIARQDSLLLEELEATVVLLHDDSATSVVSSGRVIPTMEEGGLVSRCVDSGRAACLLFQKVFLINASTFPFLSQLLKLFLSQNNAASHLFVNILFSYKDVYQSILSLIIKCLSFSKINAIFCALCCSSTFSFNLGNHVN